jgi:hypothetical protein
MMACRKDFQIWNKMIAMDHMDVVSDCIPHGSNIGKQICLNEHTRHTISFSRYNLR